MARARGPVGFTCPKIDDCIRTIEGVIEDPTTTDSLADLIGRYGTLEEIRSANESLREWGAQEEDRANKLEAENERLHKMVDELEERVADLKQELKELEPA